MKRISSKIEKEIKRIEKEKKVKDLTKNMSQLSYKLVHDEMLLQLKQKLTKITEEKPTNFVMRMEHHYVDTPNQPKPFALFGRWKGAYKSWALQKICKEKDAIVGEAFYGGLDEMGKKVIKLKIFKGKAKSKTDKLTRIFRSFIPKAKYALEFVVMDDGAVMQDPESIEEKAAAPQNGETAAQAKDPKKILKLLTQKIISTHALISPVRIQKRQHTDEDVKNLNSLKTYLQHWFLAFGKLTAADQAPRQKRKGTFTNLQKQTIALLNMAQGNTVAREQGNPTSNYNAAQEAANLGATMISQPEYKRGYSYISFKGKHSGKVYKKGDKISIEDGILTYRSSKVYGSMVADLAAKGYKNPKTNAPYKKGERLSDADRIKYYYKKQEARPLPTWCNQFAMDLAKDVLGENTPFDFLPEGKGYTNANELYEFFHEANGVLFQKLGKFETAWEEINKGKLVYFISEGDIGHIATGYPTKPEDMKAVKVGSEQDKIGKVVQAGAKTDILMINKVWGGLKNVAIFVNLNNEKSDKEPDPNLFIKVYNKIKNPVGIGAKNYIGDIKVVQQLLVNAGKDIGKGGPFDNGVDGSLGKNPAGTKTVAAIKEIQTSLGLTATGTVEMNDATWNYLYNKSKPIIESGNDNPPIDDNTNGGGNTDPEPQPQPVGKNIKASVGDGGGNSEDDVRVIQQLLVDKGFDLGAYGPKKDGVDGDCGNATKAAIKKFQKDNGITVTGIIEPNSDSWAKLSGQANPNDTPQPQPVGKSIKASVGDGGGNSKDDVRVIQQLLVDKGFDLGAYGPKKDGVDGDCGNATKTAIKKFQQDNGIAVTGIIEPNSDSWAKLSGQANPNDNNDTHNLKPEQIQFQLKGTAKPLNAKADKVLREILAQANEPNVVITSTLRTAKEQMGIMYNNIVKFGLATNKKFYGSNGKHVVQVYEDLHAAGKTAQQIKTAMEAKINELGPATVSKHCDPSNPAIDIHPKSLKNRGNFESILAADGRVNFVAPPKDPFYHLEIK
ncbi:MAG: peptidoglycan-binding protein [Aureispira sp.]|nr:peptidoglycan-binding protein [Aureispira sp.]